VKPIFFAVADPIVPRPGEGPSEYLSRTLAIHRTDADWKASEPSLSAAVAAVIERAKAEQSNPITEVQ